MAPGNIFTCTALEKWGSPEADDYQGLRVARSIDPLSWQSVADQLFEEKERKGTIGDTLKKQIISVGGPEESIQDKLQEAALQVSSGLPTELAKLVCEDAQAMAAVLHQMVPDAPELIMKLELFGERVCSRWHEDHYVCRSIVTYNCSATEYTDNSNVDFWELKNCGNNDCVIRDKSQIHSVDVGDMFMMKGSLFPGKAKSLIHKSPEVKYHGNGDIQARIVLKVDIADIEDGGTFNFALY